MSKVVFALWPFFESNGTGSVSFLALTSKVELQAIYDLQNLQKPLLRYLFCAF